MMRVLWVGCLLLAMAAPANAAVSVFGSSLARECFEGAQLGSDTFGLEACDRALRQEQLSVTDRAATLVNRGIILNRVRKLDAALADFEAALKLKPEMGEAYLNRGNTHFFRRAFESALGDYSQAIELDTSDLHVAYYNRALVHEVMKDFSAARSDIAEALRIAPDFTQAQARLAIIDRMEAKAAQETEEKSGTNGAEAEAEASAAGEETVSE